VYLGDAAIGLKPGSVKKLRVVALRYKPAEIGWGWADRTNRVYGAEALPITQYGASVMPIASPSGAFDVKVILGDVPVEADGSAHFTVPARTPVYFQLLDDRGRAVQTMRSWTTLQPGEIQSCVGCHENKNTTPLVQGASGTTAALRAAPRALTPFYGHERGFSYIREIQPILDRHCVRCHQVGGLNPRFPLTAERVRSPFPEGSKQGRYSKRWWLRPYLTLTDYDPTVTPVPYRTSTRWLKWIGRLSDPPLQPPYQYGAVVSPLFDLLVAGHGGRVALSAEELEKLAA
jgi:hypothetical protein